MTIPDAPPSEADAYFNKFAGLYLAVNSSNGAIDEAVSVIRRLESELKAERERVKERDGLLDRCLKTLKGLAGSPETTRQAP